MQRIKMEDKNEVYLTDGQCVFHLGKTGAIIMFAYIALATDKKRADCVLFANDLRDSVFAQKPKHRPKRFVKNCNHFEEKIRIPDKNIHIKKETISEYKSKSKKESPFEENFYNQASGLDFRVINSEVTDIKNTWIGNIIWIYESKNDLLFTHSISVTKSSKLNNQLILYVIGEAMKYIATVDSTSNVTITLPSESSYNQIEDKFKANQFITLQWRKKNCSIDTQMCNVIRLGNTKKITTHHVSHRKFSNDLARICRDMKSKKFICLNPLKAQERKDPNRYKK
jgi:hypothetical protein